MNVPFFDYKRFLTSHQKEIDNAIKRVLDSGNLILGEYGKKLEESFSRFTGARYAVGVANGTDALILSLKACGIGRGDQVITVPNTAVPTVSAIVTAGATPKFVDIDPNTYLMDPKSLEKAVTNRVKAIIPVHLFGQSCPMKQILSIARYRHLKVIEDCAHAHGALYNNKHVGLFGICGCFSFYPTKNLGAYGDGGMIITNNASFFKKLCALRNYGQYRLGNNQCHGYNSRLDELQASLLLVHLKYLKQRNALRKKHAALYKELLKDSNVKCPVVNRECDHIFHQYVIKTGNRSKIRSRLSIKGVMTGIHYPRPIYKQRAYLKYNRKKFPCPVSERVQKSIISLPIFPELTSREVEYVCSLLQKS